MRAKDRTAVARYGRLFVPVEQGPIVVNIEPFSEVLDKIDRELWLITARDGDRRSGLIATFVSTASLVTTLPRMMVGLAKHHYTHDLVQASNALCMHLIDESQIDWVWRFGIPSGRDVDKLHGLQTSIGVSGAPILDDALAYLDCRVETQMDAGDRTVFLAEVQDVRVLQSATPLTMKRLVELAPAEKLKQLKLDMERDTELDRAAILKWRRQQKPCG
jgi:flavin reductase (DIM6/NTAB) family NADH-FMN oxidoreductase RutF